MPAETGLFVQESVERFATLVRSAVSEDRAESNKLLCLRRESNRRLQSSPKFVERVVVPTDSLHLGNRRATKPFPKLGGRPGYLKRGP